MRANFAAVTAVIQADVFSGNITAPARISGGIDALRPFMIAFKEAASARVKATDAAITAVIKMVFFARLIPKNPAALPISDISQGMFYSRFDVKIA